MQITYTAKDLLPDITELEDQWGQEGVNFIDKDFSSILGKLPKAAIWLFWELIQNRDTRTGITPLFATSQLESQKISRGLKVLSTVGIAYRVSLQHYMVNPACILPDLKYFDSIVTQWNKLDNEYSPGINK